MASVRPLVAAKASLGPDVRHRNSLAFWLLGLYAGAQLALVAALCISHWRFPLFLETMEGTVLQHAQRLADGLWVYPTPTADFVALAYAPLYYVLCAPMIWIFGPELAALRIVATAGYALSIWVTFAATRDRTGDWRWGLIASGLFASAYKVMDAYLDTAHSDSWMIGAALAGTLMIERATTRTRQCVGVAVLCAAFWFKQHGALFAIGGVAYLTLRCGTWRSLPAYAVATVLGPALYLISPWFFGPATHLFTFVVPSSWSVFSPRSLARLGVFMTTSYPVLVGLAAFDYIGAWRDRFSSLSIWHIQGIAALASGAMATMDTGGAVNTFIPFGVFTIILGTFGLARAMAVHDTSQLRRYLIAALTALCFLPLGYDPRNYVTDTSAEQQYEKLVAVLRNLDGPVASLSLGQLPTDFALSPTMLWVAIDDLGRGRQAHPENIQTAKALLETYASQPAPRYLLLNEPIDAGWLQGRLSAHYELWRDFETQYAALSGLPGTYETRQTYPRYLYRKTGIADRRQASHGTGP
jgi:hypothetical protein